MRYFIASLLVVIGHKFLDWGCGLSVDAFEANFDGQHPFGNPEDG